MTNSQPYKFEPTRYGSIRQPDLLSDRDITFGREAATPNQFFTREVEKGVIEWTLALNSLDGGLGRVRGYLSNLINRTRGETESNPLDTRYVDSLHHPLLTRQFSTPAVSITASTAPTFRADVIASGTGTAVTATAPAGLTDGDLILVVLVHDDASTSVSAVPTGFSLIQNSDPGATGDFAIRSYQKIAATEGASWAFTLSASERWRTYVVAIQNPNPSGVGDYAQVYSTTATRFYLPSIAAPPITPSSLLSSGWEAADRDLLAASYPTSQASGFTSVGWSVSGSAADLDRGSAQFIVGTPLAAQTISAQTVKVQIAGREDNASVNAFLDWTIYVLESDAVTIRGTIVPLKRDATEFVASSSTFTNRGDSTTSTEVIAIEGDYLAFEFGAGGDPTSPGGLFRLLFGDNAAADLPEDDLTTGTEAAPGYNPWIEFTNAISFSGAGDPSAVELTGTVGSAESLVVSVAAVDEDARTFTALTSSSETLTEREDSAAVQISLAAYTESVTALGDVTHTITRSAGTTAIAGQIFVIPPASYGKRMSHVNMYGYHAMALGDGSLIRESQATTPVLETIAYDPPSTVNALVPVIIGGATADQRLAVLMTLDEARILDDLGSTPTLNATEFETNSDPGWGMIQTALFTDDIQLYSNGAIRLGTRTGAIGQTFTTTLSNVPNGGGGIGELWIPGSDIRTYWLFPTEDCGTNQAETQGVPMKIVSLNLFGDEPQDLNMPLWATKNGIGKSYTTAAIWQQGLIATDGFRIIWHNGRNNILNWPGDRPGVGDAGQLLCRGFWVKGEQLRILVQRVALYGGTGNSLYWVEEYDERTNAFHQVSRITDSESVGSILGTNALGSFPISIYSDIQYWHDDTNWNGQLITDLLRNPAVEINGVTGGGSYRAFETSASWTSPEWILPGLGKVPSVISEMHFIGDPGNGATSGTVTIDVASQSRVGMTFTDCLSRNFDAGDRWDKHHVCFANNREAVDRLQVRLTGTTGSDPVYTPQCLPVVIKGLAFLDGKIRTPIEVLGPEWSMRFG